MPPRAAACHPQVVLLLHQRVCPAAPVFLLISCTSLQHALMRGERQAGSVALKMKPMNPESLFCSSV